jgi:L-ribulose-5-phosphate 3-epimerase
MAVGLIIQPANGAEAAIARVHDLGMSNCFLSLDGYLGKFSKPLAQELSGLLEKYNIVPTAAEVVRPDPLIWNFLRGPSTIGLVPRATRAARMDALKQTSDFAALLNIPCVQTHCGFIPEDPANPLYDETVQAIREVAQHCATNHQLFLMETGQETPTTMARALKDVDQPNLAVGLDTANLILYGKANPVDAVDIIGPHVRSIHAKDGRWPTDPNAARRRSPHRHRASSTSKKSSPNSTASATPAPSPSNAKPPAHSKSWTCEPKSCTSKKSSQKVLAQQA